MSDSRPELQSKYIQPQMACPLALSPTFEKHEVWEGLFEAGAHRPVQSIVVSAMIIPESKIQSVLRLAFFQRLSPFCIFSVIKSFF